MQNTLQTKIKNQKMDIHRNSKKKNRKRCKKNSYFETDIISIIKQYIFCFILNLSTFDRRCSQKKKRLKNFTFNC